MKTWKQIRHEIIFPFQLNFGVFFLKKIGNLSHCQETEEMLIHCKTGTIGKELSIFLQKNNFNLVPYYEKHDLKHVILGYKTNAPDEMRMQSFMFGNNGFPLFITFVWLLFVIWTPEMWKDIKHHYQLGKSVKPIGHYSIQELAHINLVEFRKEMGISVAS